MMLHMLQGRNGLKDSAPPSSARSAKKLNLDNYDVVLFDCDGVLWKGGDVFPDTNRVITTLREQGKEVYFVTNNSTKSRRAYLEKFAKNDIAATKEDILTASYAVPLYLTSIGFEGKVFVLGEVGITEELDEAGIEWIGAHTTEDLSANELAYYEVDPEVKAVVVGADTGISYTRIALAQIYLSNPDVLFIATNPDLTFPSPGHILPGAGTAVAAVKACSMRDVVHVLGKPSTLLLDSFEPLKGRDKSRILMVGDRLDTDIEFGAAAGMHTFCVLTGVTKASDLDDFVLDDHPTYVGAGVEALLE